MSFWTFVFFTDRSFKGTFHDRRASLTGMLFVGQAAGPAKADLASQVRRLTRQLDASQLATRDAAEKALIEFGGRCTRFIAQDHSEHVR